MIIDEKNLIDN